MTDSPVSTSPAPLEAPMSDEWCDAQPFREHVLDLIRQSGMHWRLIAAQAGVSPSALHRLLHGQAGQRPRTIHVTLARALMQIDLDDLQTSATRRTCAAESRELLNALHALGYTTCDLRPWLTGRDLQLAMRPRVLYCTVAAAARIQACYDLLTSPHELDKPSARAS